MDTSRCLVSRQDTSVSHAGKKQLFTTVHREADDKTCSPIITPGSLFDKISPDMAAHAHSSWSMVIAHVWVSVKLGRSMYRKYFQIDCYLIKPFGSYVKL